MSAIDDSADKDKYITFNNDEFILVFRDADKSAGVTNVGHVFRESDMHNELNDVNHESPYNFSWTILDTDYENTLMMSACFEKVTKTNAKGETEDAVNMVMESHRDLEYKAHMIPQLV